MVFIAWPVGVGKSGSGTGGAVAGLWRLAVSISIKTGPEFALLLGMFLSGILASPFVSNIRQAFVIFGPVTARNFFETCAFIEPLRAAIGLKYP